MDFNMQSAHAALLGVAFGTPLLLCSIAARTDLFRREFPVLEQLHQQQADLQKHFIAGMQPTQVRQCPAFNCQAAHLQPL